jgi:hypothetical protein
LKIPKYSTQKRAGRVDEVVECLPKKSEVLSSIPRATNKKKKKKGKKEKVMVID